MTQPRPDPSAERPRLPASYVEEGAAWAQEVVGGLRRSTRTAWAVAGAAMALAALDGAALSALGPLRRPVPYVVSVNAQRDDALASRALAPGALQSDPAFTQAMLAQYVIAREEFDGTALRRDFLKVARMSDPAVQREYAAAFSPSSPLSPTHLYTPKAVLAVRISSISLLSSGTALVRFDTQRADLQGSQPEAFVADVAFAYTQAAMRNEDRYENPLGFQVTGYMKRPA